ncbi:MAG TPA: hypothetical protein VNE58_09435 [Casimicrobiaceae bacterium]|nr:hypothetical protein [Casimicrobiaceae bacterium]
MDRRGFFGPPAESPKDGPEEKRLRTMKLAVIERIRGFVQASVVGSRQSTERQSGFAVVIVAAALIGLGGCATGVVSKDSSPDAKVATVTKRAQDRWDLLLKGDVRASYAYLSPASRAVTSLERYEQRTKPGSFRSVKFETVTCEVESCRLRLRLTFDHRVMKGIEIPIEETWVIEDGQAWHVYRE